MKTSVKILLSIAILVLIAFLIIIFFQGIRIGHNYDPEITSSIGSFVGGIVGSLLTLASILYIYFNSEKNNEMLLDQNKMSRKELYVQNSINIFEGLDKLHAVYGLFKSDAVHSINLHNSITNVEKAGIDTTEARTRLSEHQIKTMEKYEAVKKHYGTDFNNLIEKSNILCDLYYDGELRNKIILYLFMIQKITNIVQFNHFDADTKDYIMSFQPHRLKDEIYKEMMKNIHGELSPDLKTLENIEEKIGKDKIIEILNPEN